MIVALGILYVPDAVDGILERKEYKTLLFKTSAFRKPVPENPDHTISRFVPFTVADTVGVGVGGGGPGNVGTEDVATCPMLSLINTVRESDVLYPGNPATIVAAGMVYFPEGLDCMFERKL